MQIIEGELVNLSIQRIKSEVLKNNGKQATVSAALGAAVGSATLASQAVLLMNTTIDVESLTFQLNGKKYEGVFNEIFLEEASKVICLVEDEIVLALIDPKNDMIYMPIGSGETRYNLKKKYVRYFLYLLIFFSFLCLLFYFLNKSDFFILLFVGFVFFVISIWVCYSMFKGEENKGLLTEKIFELLKFNYSEDINLDKFTYKDKDSFTVSWVYHYQDAFKENNPYPKDYFEKK